MRVDVFVDVCVAVRVDMGVDMCVDMCMDVLMDVAGGCRLRVCLATEIAQGYDNKDELVQNA